MIPAIPQPDPLALPAPAWLLWALLLLTFFLHLIPMNLVLGGSIIGAIARVRGRRPATGRTKPQLAHIIVKAMPVLISATVTLGVAALLFLQVLYGRVFFASAVVMGWWWLSVIGLLILTYYAAYLLAMRESSLGGSRHRCSPGSIAAVVGLIALIYGNNMTLMLKPAELVARYAADGGGVAAEPARPDALPAPPAHGAGRDRRERPRDRGRWASCGGSGTRPSAQWAVRYGAFICAAATVVEHLRGPLVAGGPAARGAAAVHGPRHAGDWRTARRHPAHADRRRPHRARGDGEAPDAHGDHQRRDAARRASR